MGCLRFTICLGKKESKKKEAKQVPPRPSVKNTSGTYTRNPSTYPSLVDGGAKAKNSDAREGGMVILGGVAAAAITLAATTAIISGAGGGTNSGDGGGGSGDEGRCGGGCGGGCGGD